MAKFNAVVAIAAAALLSGPVWAASLQPAAGDLPVVNRASAVTSTLQRRSVESDAARHMPAAGELNARAAMAPASMLTRADVRGALHQAISHGFHIKVGDSS